MIQKFNLKKIIKNEKLVLCGIFIILGLITYIISREEDKTQVAQAQVPDLDELIPAGYVLLPVELVNREALASIMGSTAVVDILTVNPTNLSPQTKIASRIKIIRSPKNPDFFALLVEENASAEILSKPGPYFALIQNKRQTNSNFYKSKKQTKVEVSYQE
jgi:hypothetical protein